MTNPLNYSTPIQPVLDPSQHSQNIATFIPNTSNFQSEITPRKLWPQFHPSQHHNYQLDTTQIPLYDFPYAFQNLPCHTFTPQDTTQPKTPIIPPTQVSNASNAMTQTLVQLVHYLDPTENNRLKSIDNLFLNYKKLK